MRVWLACFFGFPLAACSVLAGPPGPILAVFDVKEAEFIRHDGKTKIEGHAFLKQKAGGTLNVAGEVVTLVPATAYARERFEKFYGERKFTASLPLVEPPPEYKAFMRTTKTESSGHFEFEKVPPGTYFVATQMRYQRANSFFSDGGAIYESVTVTGKETDDKVKVVVSGS